MSPKSGFGLVVRGYCPLMPQRLTGLVSMFQYLTQVKMAYNHIRMISVRFSSNANYMRNHVRSHMALLIAFYIKSYDLILLP